jgi:hypothetical protein
MPIRSGQFYYVRHAFVTNIHFSLRDHAQLTFIKNRHLTSNLDFESANEPGQWTCWDFRDLCVRPTHYTMTTFDLKSCAVEGSLHGESWESSIGRLTVLHIADWDSDTASFPGSHPAECRFIRPTEIESARLCHWLSLEAVEFFGTLFESISSRNIDEGSSFSESH